LRLDVSVADALAVDVGERAEELIYVELHLENRHGGLDFVEVAAGAVDGFRDELEDQVQVDLILLRCHQSCLHTHLCICIAYPVSVGVVESLELDDVGMADDAHDLELSVLGGVSGCDGQHCSRPMVRTLKRLS